MSNPAQPQRAWRAACPNCGAPVEFASASSPMAVCSYCRSTLARDGESLRRIGQSAELFDDHTPLQVGTAGRWQGAAFTLVGRLQMRDAEGAWNEWHALFDNGRSGWLSEDNGRYVMAFDQPAPPLVPSLGELAPGEGIGIDGRLWQVASVTRARVGAAEGELPLAPPMDAEYPLVELRNAQGEVGTLDHGDPTQVHWSIGRVADLAELALTGLREPSEKTLSARGLSCPSCGTALEIRLETTQSIACHQCHAVIDVSQGLGADMAYERQPPAPPGGRPRLALGSTGRLALGGAEQDWQIVGYVERAEIPEQADDEAATWREYLLYARETGFAFLVDADDGWSWVVPITGAPTGRGDTAQWAGQTYRRRYGDYRSRVSWVEGEFYWRLQRGQETRHSDFAVGARRLNREQTAQEVTWSAGETLDAQGVARAFGLPPGAPGRFEASPLSTSGGMPFLNKLFVAFVLLVLLVMLVSALSDDECDGVRQAFGAHSREYAQCQAHASGAVRAPRTGGGSFGGWGSGGGHK